MLDGPRRSSRERRLTTGPRTGIALALTLGASVALALAACEVTPPANPFQPVGGGGAGAGGEGEGGEFDAGPNGDPTLGGPCTVDDQCDDGFDCTFDSCDLELLRCRFLPDDSQCQNEAFCDGLEVCDNKLGCILGEPITCSDGSPCTINTCDEATDRCNSEPRDADRDGDPDDKCGGGDCNDLNPAVSSLADEVCANGVDDDCDGTADEQFCAAPTNDTCLDPLDVAAVGTYPMLSAAAQLHYAASCGVTNMAAARDVVAAVVVPAGPPTDVQLTARTDSVDVALALMGQCDQPATEIACSPGFDHPAGGRVAKVRGRSLGDMAMPLALPAYVFTEGASAITFEYELLPASTVPSNETCGTAALLPPSTPTTASIIGVASDLAIVCGSPAGELVYQIDVPTTSDLEIFGVSTDGDGRPVLSLRSNACALPSDEIACNTSSGAYLFRHSVAAGSYFVAVGATAPTDVVVSYQLSPPTPTPPDEDCTSAPVIPQNQTIDVLLNNHQDDHDTGCLPGGVDAAYTLDLAQASDVLVLGRYSNGDTAAVDLALPGCAMGDSLSCATATISPVRSQKRSLAAGSYRVLAESLQGQPMQLTALVRPALPPTIVPFANACGDVLTIAPTGGFFQGNTINAQPDFDAGCDQGGQPVGGAADQILQLDLAQTKRVVLDMQGSGYSTLLSVREGLTCAGTEVTGACAAGYFPERSFLDVELNAGSYYILVDGYAGQAGPWFLDVFVVDP
jgi:Putative metal-binding motif